MSYARVLNLWTQNSLYQIIFACQVREKRF